MKTKFSTAENAIKTLPGPLASKTSLPKKVLKINLLGAKSVEKLTGEKSRQSTSKLLARLAGRSAKRCLSQVIPMPKYSARIVLKKKF